jgi:hypothetical protein
VGNHRLGKRRLGIPCVPLERFFKVDENIFDFKTHASIRVVNICDADVVTHDRRIGS